MSRLSTFLRQEREAQREAQREATPEATYERARRVLERGVQEAVQERLHDLVHQPPEPPAAVRVRTTSPACRAPARGRLEIRYSDRVRMEQDARLRRTT